MGQRTYTGKEMGTCPYCGSPRLFSYTFEKKDDCETHIVFESKGISLFFKNCKLQCMDCGKRFTADFYGTLDINKSVSYCRADDIPNGFGKFRYVPFAYAHQVKSSNNTECRPVSRNLHTSHSHSTAKTTNGRVKTVREE